MARRPPSLPAVFHTISGLNLNLDHHRQAPFANLWTDIDTGLGTRPFASGGDAPRGSYAGRGNTCWNVYRTPATAIKLPACAPTNARNTWGAFVNFILPSYSGATCTGPPLFWYVRTLNGTSPRNLYAAQRVVRLAGE